MGIILKNLFCSGRYLLMGKIYFLFIILLFSCTSNKPAKVTLDSLLDEMISYEEATKFPDIPYVSIQSSSYDRASKVPGGEGWFANNDGFGSERTDTVDGRIEKVMMDVTCPGVITRIWITAIDKKGAIRFYFDGASSPQLVIPAYDLMKLNFAGDITGGFLLPHTSYVPDGKGGSTLFFPIPFKKGCKVTYETAQAGNETPHYYHINYRKYPDGICVETFSQDMVEKLKGKIKNINNLLQHPKDVTGLKKSVKKSTVSTDDSMSISLPKGEMAIYKIKFNIRVANLSSYGQVMRNLILGAEFDGEKTVNVPLSDFSGGGAGAPEVDSWFLCSDGTGSVVSRWIMPYKDSSVITLKNISGANVDVTMDIETAPLKWDSRSLYFYVSWKQQKGIELSNDPSDYKRCSEWNFCSLSGRGVYKGDVLTLYNHSSKWYGEGDEKIYVDNEDFPSHFGTGTEDYYNSSWAPVVIFNTPFGGAPRADNESSEGYNTFFRLRGLDGIPFHKNLKFDLEMLSWEPGTVDYASTVYWYGDKGANADNCSATDDAKPVLIP